MQNEDLRQDDAAVSPSIGVAMIVGNSDWAEAIREQIVCVAGFSSGVLISGPSGTGKDLIARAIHAHSSRADKPFIPVDCTSFVSDLFPSHMFGHVKGAFTGAEHESRGCFRAADGGTVFLDEIGELEPHLQAKLLRVIEEKAVVPVGAAQPIPVDVRIIAATNRELAEEVDAGRFRKDLYYRLNIVELRTCPLKDRPDDIAPLANHFVAAFCAENGLPAATFCTAALGVLRDYDWPGNVRELRNVLERALVFNHGHVLTHKSLLPLLRDDRTITEAPAPNEAASADAVPTNTNRSKTAVYDAVSACERCVREREQWASLAELERYHIQKTLEYTSHNQTAAAELLGISSRVLSRLIKEHGIDVSASRPGRPTKARPSNRPGSD
jgi:DNA-binding NtrC family response regulator